MLESLWDMLPESIRNVKVNTTVAMLFGFFGTMMVLRGIRYIFINYIKKD